AEEAYLAVLGYGVGSIYYERALYKLGWTFYKQDLYEEALKQFIALLDHKVSIGYDFDQKENKIEKKRIDDTFRVISLSFSNMGGAESIDDYFAKYGKRKYEDKLYSHLAEFFFTKRRYNDAAVTYNSFVTKNPYHKVSPLFSMRVIEIYLKGGFPKLVIEAKKQYASTYSLKSKYWTLHNKDEYKEAIGYLKKNIIDLANHYHAVFQEPRFVKKKPESFSEASHWYREFLLSFPKEKESPDINFQLAELLLENKNYSLSALEYEKTAYDYPVHEKSKKAAYAAVYAHREHLKNAPPAQKNSVKRSVIRSSLRMVDTYPKHEKATVVLSAAIDDMFEMKDYVLTIKSAHMLLKNYPASSTTIKRNAWLVIGHSSFELNKFVEAEQAYIEVLALMDRNSKNRVAIVDNLAVSIYRQGEAARSKEDYKGAVKHFLRIASLAPVSKIRSTAEYDAAAVLIQIMDLDQAAVVLLDFRKNYPGHKLQHDVTKKIAYVYKESGKHKLAAKEFERIFAESKDNEVKREALLTAAELYEKANDTSNALNIYQRFVKYYPKPVEFALETYYKIAMVYKSRKEMGRYHNTLKHIINTDKNAGAERTDRTRYLAAQSSLVLIEPQFEKHLAIKLVAPFKRSLKKKKKSMEILIKTFNRLVDYKVADVTAASTYYIAEIYYNFNRSLLESERPKKLNDLELEEYNLMIEDQAFPFEEKTIAVHEKNMELLTLGVYSKWIDKSIEKLAALLPARYAKPEQNVAYIEEIDVFRYKVPRKMTKQNTTPENNGNKSDKPTDDIKNSADDISGNNKKDESKVKQTVDETSETIKQDNQAQLEDSSVGNSAAEDSSKNDKTVSGVSNEAQSQ
ncbi:MAG: tetratricopeptide repeat protein, partial [Gammaproteobacteria bacterium]